MHGLINRAIQRFAEDTQGIAVWAEVAGSVQPGLAGFEAMLTYDDALTMSVLDALSARTGTPKPMLLEDIGTYLVSHPRSGALRRLLRFGGESFTEFLYSLEDLAERVELAVPDLVLPSVEVTEHAPGRFSIVAGAGLPGLGHVLAGLLRAMADDYGTLALVEIGRCSAEGCRVSVAVAEAAFSAGREFALAPQADATA